LALGGGEWSPSCPGYFTPQKEPWYPGGLGGPQCWFGCSGEEKNSLPI